MSELLDNPGSGIQSTRQFADPNELPVLRQRTSIVDVLQQAQAPAPPAPDPIAPMDSPDAIPQDPGFQVPAPPPAPAPIPQRAIPVPGAPPTLPADSPRVQDRINKLYAQRQAATEEVTFLREQLAQQNARIDALLRGAPAAPQSSPLGPSPDSPPSAGQFISRTELLEILRQERAVASQESAVRSAHVISRIEAEKDFPDVFGSPELRTAAEQIWAADPLLQRDPHGPYKAAALARGLSQGHPSPAPVATSADVRKALMSTGASVVESGAGQPNQAHRYQQALARARFTQKPEDFVLAHRIAQGLA